jgi:hypothetical protein
MTRGVGGHSPANITKHLKGIDFPAHLDDLVKQAKKNHADQEVIEEIKNLPDQEYHSVADIMKGYGQKH